MKFFQKLLLAPAALGFLTPIVANANESNFRDVTNYSQDQVEVTLDTFKPLSNKNPLLAGGEGSNHSHSSSSNDFDVDSFNSTTTAAFTTNFALGNVEGSTQENLAMNYDYEIALSSSFTGSDSLDVVLNAGVSKVMPELDMTNTSGVLEIDSISYTASLGDRVTAFVAQGGGAAGSSLYNTACVYGAQADTFSDCGVSAANIDASLGTALGANFDIGKGFSASIAYEGEGMTTDGFLSKEALDAHGAQVSYLSDTYGVSLSWANIEKHIGYFVNGGNENGGHDLVARDISVAVNAFYAPDIDNFPSISAGLETTKLDHSLTVDSTNDETSHYFVGLQWDDFGNGVLGAAMGSKEPYAKNADSQTMYEVFYSYNYADGITITPLLYSKDNTGSTADETGLIVKTTFSF
tara:strand:+ start:901 stop:2124 length:1224 start_codon:yes stop_codon:yes gene_type:complete